MSKLIFANSKDSNMLYAVGQYIADPFFYLEKGNKKYIFLDYREFAAFNEKKQKSKIEVVLLNDLAKKITKLKDKTSESNKLALLILTEFNLLDKKIKVPANFSIDMADFLRSKGIILEVESPFFHRREKKNKVEIKLIKENINNTLDAFKKIEEILRASIIKDDKIYFQEKILTSEFLKKEVDRLLLEKNMFNQEDVIISSGYQTAIPHHTGSGEIKPNTFIICDIFPRNKNNGYFADITRTFVKGKASNKMLSIYNAVKKAQKKAIKSIKPGIEAKKIHQICEKSFDKDGFNTRGNRGFIHGTGHSFGLDIHEGPYLNSFSKNILEPGNIITVEPGLYFPKFGGVRIEDDILVTKNGCENLVNYPKSLVIK
jgi:Xaa-Pro aminopeptidase